MESSTPPAVAVWRRSAVWVALRVLGVLAWIAHRALVLGDTGVVAENGFLENCQAAVLLLCALVGLHTAATGHAADRCLLLAWTRIGMSLRELELARMQAVPPWLDRLSSHRGRTQLLTDGYLVLGAVPRRPVLLLALAAADRPLRRDTDLARAEGDPGGGG